MTVGAPKLPCPDADRMPSTPRALAQVAYCSRADDGSPVDSPLHPRRRARCDRRHRAAHGQRQANREWIARLGVDHQREHGYAYWQCRDKGTDQLLGFCGWREHDLGASLGYAFAEPTRGNGYAKEAAGAVVAWGLANIGAERLYASVRPPNPASCKVLDHAGMSLVRECVDAHGPRLIYALPGRPPLPQTR